MKKWIFISLFILCTVCVGIYIAPLFQNGVDVKIVEKGDKVNSTNTEKKEITKEQIYKGDLLLVNKDYPVQKDSIRSDIINVFQNTELVRGYVVLDRNIHLSKDIVKKFLKIVDAAEKEGIHHFLISSGYRDFKEQRKLYEKMGSDYALPAGYSEHNLGLSLDVGSTQMKMEKAPEGKWIEDNVWKYGFVLRYPKNKSNITGIQYEPWHIRYVGLPHSAIMQKNKFTLEEYLDFLKEKKEISTNVEGKEYTVSYYKVSKNTTINVPVNQHYEISGNNMDGVIMTVHK
ncbi:MULTISPECIES: VanY-A/VanY-F/VanY-M family D-Ala-D-Ala carboxypeptidase [Bacillus]|uniref:VanY-A/VanY-F/VanY-M family D-Ala-D-Ala carboxypeptidase n=1 Tax=Bacillus pseudomycoides TaxID=64104 RepID=A0A2H3MRH9_9BACI|nr:VanY-A/VanY-F/VanY-M family D-Ala-D-Ala carboxypeptidase [Bacillus pseudomycoides]EEM18214.1 D-alanyl-D-alanine carboxypeptidase [Bacillus pseudomycoides DSM 12442]MBD5799831.1 D-Ala-D-Ala carboxypeptidase VanY [Bacillus pseudomycoides]MDR4327984.1 VanY-A/VanY-F/VanY-M family D-Ala-D-Ala carboxypeptidase [Bacillus pseudomycoides]MED1476630.1 VanY-A/VanY-F/VanY-M family D-Ala-D-Ala carboxypeptidase [Bacillus pseudomycoides]MED1539143.1 VanY-A/VanY-F/VanY-M family D-Ala-D-Ala carboxypeptidase